MEARIIPIDASKFDEVCAVIDAVARERRYLAFTEAAPKEQMQAFFRGLMDDAASCSYLAVVGEHVVGWCDIQRAIGQARRHVGMLGIGLLSHCRGRGLGRRLMVAAIQHAWSNGLTRIELTVRSDNHNARSLYERLGFEHEGVKRRVFRLDGEYFDCDAMALLKGDDA